MYMQVKPSKCHTVALKSSTGHLFTPSWRLVDILTPTMIQAASTSCPGLNIQTPKTPTQQGNSHIKAESQDGCGCMPPGYGIGPKFEEWICWSIMNISGWGFAGRVNLQGGGSIHSLLLATWTHTIEENINCLPHILFQLLYNIIVFRCNGIVVNCCCFGCSTRIFLRNFTIWKHREKGVLAWDAASNGRLCSNRNPVRVPLHLLLCLMSSDV